ncbi:unnamed protein product [Heligmosomoides polygyrus]|uniref:Uncharacterized protein n=1 Tax=Heligmosomoides polygyrus TaxID=6339 RepID=A0A183GN36_HELPZ|nr:unnamed protein product [Heligmosomoides polygyrus]
MCFMSVFREESETVLALKGLTPTGTLPLGILNEGRRGVQEGRHESETVLQLKGLNPGGKLPQGILSGGKSALVEIVADGHYSSALNPIECVTRMCFMSVFREESETVLALKGLTPTGTLPLGILNEGRRGVQEGRCPLAISSLSSRAAPPDGIARCFGGVCGPPSLLTRVVNSF